MSQQKSKFSDSDFSTHVPIDSTDPGFMIKGHKLRWVSSNVEVRRATRIWTPLKISALPQGIRTKITDRNPRWLDGDTIRRRDLVLTYAPLELVEQRRMELRKNQALNEGVLNKKVKRTNEVVSTGQTSRAKSADSDQFK